MTVAEIMITEVIPTAGGKSLCLGLQFVRLEGNPEGRQGLQKLCNFGGIYYEPTGNEIV